MTDADILGAPIPPASLIIRDGGTVALLTPITAAFWEVHFGAARIDRGARALSAFRHMLRAFWCRFSFVTELIGPVKEANRPARHLAWQLGFRPSSRAIVLGSVVIFYRISRP